MLKEDFTGSMELFEEEVRDWLIDLIEITTSIGYNHMNKEILTEKDTKNFVAKNILQNIKVLMESHKEIPLESRLKLMKVIN